MTLSEIQKDFTIGEDDILGLNLSLFEMPNPYFKHVNMKLTYKHIIEENLANLKS